MDKEEFKEGTDFYFDESGLMVLTKEYHLKRGHCCGNGCRHCPFDYENVEGKLRKELKSEKTALDKPSTGLRQAQADTLLFFATLSLPR